MIIHRSPPPGHFACTYCVRRGETDAKIYPTTPDETLLSGNDDCNGVLPGWQIRTQILPPAQYPQPYTPSPIPPVLYPQPYTPIPIPPALYPQPFTPSPMSIPPALYPQPYTPSPMPPSLYSHPYTPSLYPHPYTPIPIPPF